MRNSSLAATIVAVSLVLVIVVVVYFGLFPISNAPHTQLLIMVVEVVTTVVAAAAVAAVFLRLNIVHTDANGANLVVHNFHPSTFMNCMITNTQTHLFAYVCTVQASIDLNIKSAKID